MRSVAQDIMYDLGEEVRVANGKTGEVLRIAIGKYGINYEVGYWNDAAWVEVFLPASQIDRIEEAE